MQNELWWQHFFDNDYEKLWSYVHPPALCEQEANGLFNLLNLQRGDRILDAPCGYGRISIPLAKLGLQVCGIDYSKDLLSTAKLAANKAGISDTIDFIQGDLRTVSLPSGFQAAVNLFSSIGYGSESDDEKSLRTIHNAIVPDGFFYLGTIHRDAIVARRARGETTGVRGPNGITLKEKNEFDPMSGSIHSTWTWNSPTFSGSKKSTIRIYSITELIALLTRVGFKNIHCLEDDFRTPFLESSIPGPVGILCQKKA